MQTFVIATHHPWNIAMFERLCKNSEAHFELITEKSELNVDRLKALAPTKVFFPHWSYKIPKAIFQNFECVIFHMTDLPFGRGGSPLQNLLARGIYETKISALKCVEEFDAGPIYLKRPLDLKGTAEDIYRRAAHIFEEMIQVILRDDPKPVEQRGEVVYFKRRKPEEGNLTEARSLVQAFDYIRMLDCPSYPPAFLETDFLNFEFQNVEQKDGELTATVKIRPKELQ